MAVKPEIIKARLKVLFPKANLSTKRIDTIVAKLAPMTADDADDAAVDVVLNLANDFNSFEEIAREDDRIRTLEAKANPAPPTPTPIPAPTPTPVPVPDDTPAWAKAMIDSNQKLAADLEAIKTGRITETKKQTAQSLLDSSEVLKALKPEIKTNWLNRIDVNSETPLEEQVKSLETEFTDLRQSMAQSTNYSSGVPFNTEGVATATKEDVSSIVDNLL